MQITKELKTFCNNVLLLMEQNKLSENEMMKIMHIGRISFKNSSSVL